jgi:hypothetical protein
MNQAFRRAGARFWLILWRDSRGIGTLELVLIAAVLILIALLFKDWIIDFLKGLMGKADDKAQQVFN